MTEDEGSSLIHSTGKITVRKAQGTSNGAQSVVVEGSNSANVKDNSHLECAGVGNRVDIDKCGVMLYQLTSGDLNDGLYLNV